MSSFLVCSTWLSLEHIASKLFVYSDMTLRQGSYRSWASYPITQLDLKSLQECRRVMHAPVPIGLESRVGFPPAFVTEYG